MPLIWMIGFAVCIAIPTARKWNTLTGHMGFDTGLIYGAIWSVACAGFALGFVLTGTPEAIIAVVFPLIAAALALAGCSAIRHGKL